MYKKRIALMISGALMASPAFAEDALAELMLDVQDSELEVVLDVEDEEPVLSLEEFLAIEPELSDASVAEVVESDALEDVLLSFDEYSDVNLDALDSLVAESVEALSEELAESVSHYANPEVKEAEEVTYEAPEVVELTKPEPADKVVEKESPIAKERVSPAGPNAAMWGEFLSARGAKVGPNGLYYLKNIPDESFLVINEPQELLPRENQVHFKDGGRFYGNPVSTDALQSFCTLQFSDSGLPRRLTAGDERRFRIDDVKSSVKRYNVEGLGQVYRQELVFDIANQHLTSMYCFSDQIPSDMAIEHVREITGDAIDLRLREYVEI